jgi:hypothetical protein
VGATVVVDEGPAAVLPFFFALFPIPTVPACAESHTSMLAKQLYLGCCFLQRNVDSTAENS